MTPSQKGIKLLQHPIPIVPIHSKFVYGCHKCEVQDWAFDSKKRGGGEVGEEKKIPKFCESNGCT